MTFTGVSRSCSWASFCFSSYLWACSPALPMHNNLPLPLRPPSSISFLIEKKYPDNLEYFQSYLLYLMDFSSSHLNLYPPASNLNLTWKQHKVIGTGVRAAIRSKVADVELGGVPSRGGLTWPLAATRERERNLDGRGRVTFESECVTMTERRLAFPDNPPMLIWLPHVQAQPGRSWLNTLIFFTAQYLQSVPAFVAQNIPETPVKIWENNWISPTFHPTYLHSTVHPQIRTFSSKRPSCWYWLRFVY